MKILLVLLPKIRGKGISRQKRLLTEGMSGFLVPEGTAGFRIGQVDDMLGERLRGNAELVLGDCRILARYLVGEGNKMFEKSMEGRGITLLSYLAYGIGHAQAS